VLQWVGIVAGAAAALLIILAIFFYGCSCCLKKCLKASEEEEEEKPHFFKQGVKAPKHDDPNLKDTEMPKIKKSAVYFVDETQLYYGSRCKRCNKQVAGRPVDYDFFEHKDRSVYDYHCSGELKVVQGFAQDDIKHAIRFKESASMHECSRHWENGKLCDCDRTQNEVVSEVAAESFEQPRVEKSLRGLKSGPIM
jgi:hypothetical protein